MAENNNGLSPVVWIEQTESDGVAGKPVGCGQPAPDEAKSAAAVDEATSPVNHSAPTPVWPSPNQESMQQQQRSVRWADGAADQGGSTEPPQPPSSSSLSDDAALQIEEFERKMKESNREALELVDRLSQMNNVGVEPVEPKDKGNSDSAVAEKSTVPDRPLMNGDLEVDSYRINPELMRQPVDVVMLEGAKLLIIDDETGAIVLQLESKNTVSAKSFKTKWKSPKCACAVRGKQQILVGAAKILAEYGSENESGKETAARSGGGYNANQNGEVKVAAEKPSSPTQKPLVETETDTKYDMQICRFDDELRLVERVEAPKFLRNKVVITCRMCHVSETDCIYLAASTPNNAYLYELSADCRWSEIYTGRCRSYVDMEPLAVLGPVTELLLVESSRQYVQLVSVYNSAVVAQRMIAVSERPDAISIDERGNFFVFDKATSKVGLHSRVHFEKLRDVAFAERALCRISAYGRLLAVLGKNFKELKVYKY